MGADEVVEFFEVILSHFFILLVVVMELLRGVMARNFPEFWFLDVVEKVHRIDKVFIRQLVLVLFPLLFYLCIECGRSALACYLLSLLMVPSC